MVHVPVPSVKNPISVRAFDIFTSLFNNIITGFEILGSMEVRMRAVVQRVNGARVEVDKTIVGKIDRGLLVFLGVGEEDSEKDGEYLANKIVHLRIFPDEEDLMNHSLIDTDGAMLVVSQFTLWGDCRKGRRPSFIRAARPDKARELYEHFISLVKAKGLKVATGEFREMMDVHLVNDGPVTLILESP